MPRRTNGLDAELSTSSARPTSRAPEPRAGGKSQVPEETRSNCQLSSRLIVFVCSGVVLFVSFLLLVVPKASPRLIDIFKLANVFCTEPIAEYYNVSETYMPPGANETLTVNADRMREVSYTVSGEEAYLTDPALDALRSRFRAILALGFMTLFTGLMGLVTACSPDLSADHVRCRMYIFICFSLPVFISSVFIALYCFGFRLQANHVARTHFSCLLPFLPPTMTRPEDINLDDELNLAGACSLIASIFGLTGTFWAGNLIGWRTLSRSAVIACNTLTCMFGAGLMMIGFLNLSASGKEGQMTPGDLVVVAFGFIVVALSGVGLAAAKKESQMLCNIFSGLTTIFTSTVLGLAIVFFLYPEAMDLLLLTHWKSISGSFGGMSKTEYNQITEENSTFIGIMAIILCTVLVINIFATFTYKQELKRAGGGGHRQIEEVEYVDVFQRRKARENQYRERVLEEGAALTAQSSRREPASSGAPSRVDRSASMSSAASSAAGTGKKSLRDRLPTKAGMSARLPGRKPAPEPTGARNARSSRIMRA
jgi:hypothetical protein